GLVLLLFQLLIAVLCQALSRGLLINPLAALLQRVFIATAVSTHQACMLRGLVLLLFQLLIAVLCQALSRGLLINPLAALLQR
ncbi:hypothetical protein C7E25_23795, partial [Stenotrophomonas maltophilia]